MKKHEFYDVISRSQVGALMSDMRLPSFLYFTEVVERKIDALSACLPSGFQINYAFKANPNLGLLRFLRSKGLGADVASIGELCRAIEAGFSPGTIEFTGPGKTREELELAMDMGVAAINAESLAEVRLIGDLARRKALRVNLGVRINPRLKPASSAMRMGGDSQFGIIEDDLAEAFDVIGSAADSVHFVGYHFHLGSQFMRAEDIVANFESILEVSSRISSASCLRPEMINFGGGWGVDMSGKKDSLDLDVVRIGLARLFPSDGSASAAGATRFVIEPGRFLVAECGLYAVPVLYKKRGYKRNFIVVDGGMHHHLAAAGGIGQGIRRNYEIDSFTADATTEEREKFTVVGCLCLPDDILASDVDLPASIVEHDVLVFFNSGAYAFTTSPTRFLSHPEPGEVVL